MSTKAGIIAAIVARVGTSSCSLWRIGLTHDLAARKQKWSDDGESVTHWMAWTADSLSDAQDIESHFINNKGMKGGTGGNLSSSQTVYVYIF